ncbi:hypothetical protein J3R83DRAFT_4509 [Lanmaoa asiatica]|nr:hypothetical protein J3R83DRAFT_4509 [Lanmaoa asiatica]
MESFPLFFRIRAITFACIMLFSFLWLILLCVEMFSRWSMSDQISQSLMILFILTNTTTLIVLPMLILVQFRIWLDTARLLLLLVLQVGAKSLNFFSTWNRSDLVFLVAPDDMGVCQLIGVYTIIACWIIPAILVFYSTYFVVVVYLQSRIPVVVEPKLHKRRSGVDLEMGSTDSLCSWNEKMKEIIRVQGSNTDTSVPPRPLLLPTMVHTRQSSLPQSSAPQRESTLPNAPRRQSTVPWLPHTGQQPHPALPPIPDRHRSLPAFKHGDTPHLHPLFTLSIPRPLANNGSPSHPQTPSSHSYSPHPPANLQNQLFSVGPSVADVQSPKDHRDISRHFSMMHLSSSPREMQSAEGSPTARPTARARLSKPIPAHLM